MSETTASPETTAAEPPVVCLVIDTIEHDGERHAAGAQVPLPPPVAARLRELGVVAALNDIPAPVPTATSGNQPQQTLTERLAAAIAAMLAEDPESARQDWWTTDGRPDVRALGHRVGERISAAERDAAWAAHRLAAE